MFSFLLFFIFISVEKYKKKSLYNAPQIYNLRHFSPIINCLCEFSIQVWRATERKALLTKQFHVVFNRIFNTVHRILFWRGLRVTDAFMCYWAWTKVGWQHFISARFVLPPHLSTIVGLQACPNELRTRKTLDACRTRMPKCTCIDGPLHWCSSEREKNLKKLLNRLAASSFFQRFRHDRHRLYDLTTDLSDIPTDLWLKPRERFARRVRMQGDRSTDNGQTWCVQAQR